MGLINKIFKNSNVNVVNTNDNAVPLKNILIATESISVNTNSTNVIISNIISPSSLPIKSMTFECSISTTAVITASTAVTTNPIENIFKSFTLRSNPSNKILYDLDGTLSEMSLFQRYLKRNGEFNQSNGLYLNNTATTATSITTSGTWNYISDFSISSVDASKSGLSLNLSLNSLSEFYDNTSASSIVITLDINIYATYEAHEVVEIELIKTIIPINVTGIARIGYLMAQGKTILSQYLAYGQDWNITDISFSTNGGRNYLYNKTPFSHFIKNENVDYKNSLSVDNVPISNQSKLDGVNNLFTPIFVTTPNVYIEINFGTIPNVTGYETNSTGTIIIPNSDINISNECILYQIALR